VATTIPDALGILAWSVGPDVLLDRLGSELEKLPADDEAGAMSASEKKEALAEADVELLRLQREGDALAEMLEGDGLTVRRENVPPHVLLGVEVVLK
jgi:hypothetical protein